MKTNEFLAMEKNKLLDKTYIEFLKRDDECLSKEYSNDQEIIISVSDIQFEKELTLHLGGLTVNVFHVEAPRSVDTVLIYVLEEKTLFLGDATSEDFFNNGYMDRNKLNNLINTIENIDCNYCILSHTEPFTKPDLLNYLNAL